MVISTLKSALSTLNGILSIKPPPNLGVVPPPLVPLSTTRGGMSALRAANKVLEKGDGAGYWYLVDQSYYEWEGKGG